MNSELTPEWRKWHNISVYETGRPPHFEGTGNTVSFKGHFQTLSGTGTGTGTGALATLHGQGTFQGSFTTGAGTYVFQYHFDP